MIIVLEYAIFQPHMKHPEYRENLHSDIEKT